MQYKKRKGFTLIELCIAVVIMASIMGIGVAMVNLVTTGTVNSELTLRVTEEDREFTRAVDEAIQESTAVFTIPEASFTEGNLTVGWNYLGLMQNVSIPEDASRTGEALTGQEALVLIQYAGNTAPASVPANSNVLNVGGEYFVQTIMGHSYADRQGVAVDYSLIFEPVDPVVPSAQTIKYDLVGNVTDADGNVPGDGTATEISTTINSLNAVQVVYKGTSSNPAVAIAFRSDFIPTDYHAPISEYPPGTVVLVLDVSNSMVSNQLSSGVTRLKALKETAKQFIEELSVNPNVNIILVPFHTHVGYDNRNIGPAPGWIPDTWIWPISDKDMIKSQVDNMKTGVHTNVGDGLRMAYHQLQKHKTNVGDSNVGTISLLLLTDGAMNHASYTDTSRTAFYEGTDTLAPALTDIWDGNPGAKAREYTEVWGNKITSDFATDSYLVSFDGGMSIEDKTLLEQIFGVGVFDVSSQTELKDVFDEMGESIDENMWAFEGPRS